MVIAEISAFPIGKGESLSESVAEVLRVIRESGLKYQLGAMGTVVEGEWDEIIKVITGCREVLVRSNNRIYMTIKIDERKAVNHDMVHKLRAVEEKL